MPAAVPFKGAVCATLCKSAVQGADVITYRSHDSVFRMLFLVAKAQINVLCLYRVLLFKLHPARKPHRGRGCGDTVEQTGLGGCPQRKQSRQRIATQNDFDVFREIELLFQCGDTLRFLTEQVIPTLEQQYPLPENVKIILGGYSLAGLFALWASTQTDLFYGVAAASPSVWFPG